MPARLPPGAGRRHPQFGRRRVERAGRPGRRRRCVRAQACRSPASRGVRGRRGPRLGPLRPRPSRPSRPQPWRSRWLCGARRPAHRRPACCASRHSAGFSRQGSGPSGPLLLCPTKGPPMTAHHADTQAATGPRPPALPARDIPASDLFEDEDALPVVALTAPPAAARGPDLSRSRSSSCSSPAARTRWRVRCTCLSAASHQSH